MAEGIRIKDLNDYTLNEEGKINEEDLENNFLLIDDEKDTDGTRRVSLKAVVDTLEKASIEKLDWSQIDNKPEWMGTVETDIAKIKEDTQNIPTKSANDPSSENVYVSPAFMASEISKIPVIDDAGAVSNNKLWSSERTSKIIDDNVASAEGSTWSSKKISEELANQKINASDTYDADSSDAMSGKAVASAISGKANTTDLGDMKFRVNKGLAQYSKDGGEQWLNFRKPTGTATASQVLSGATFANSSSDSLTGTMPNNGAVNESLTSQGASYTIPEGYHNGSGKVTATYSQAISYCFRTHSNVTTVSNFDVKTFCNNIKNTHGITIDWTTLTNSNFIIGNFRSTDLRCSAKRTEGTDKRAPYELRMEAQFTTPSISYSASNGVLTVNACSILGGVRLWPDEGSGYPFHYATNTTFDVFLVLIK